MQQAQKLFDNDSEFKSALRNAENALSMASDAGLLRESGDYYAKFREDAGAEFPFITDIFEDRDGKYQIDSFSHLTEDDRLSSVKAWGYTMIKPECTSTSTVELEYWDSSKYNRQMGDATTGSFQMTVHDRRSIGNCEISLEPSASADLDDNFSVLAEVNRLPGSKEDLPCAHLYIGDDQKLTVWQRNQELLLTVGNNQIRFENTSISQDFEINGVPQYEQAIVVK